MSQLDRLTALIQRFQLSVVPAPLAQANLVVVSGQHGNGDCILFAPKGVQDVGAGQVIFAAWVDWADGMNPLPQALPAQTCFDISQDGDAQALVRVLRHEVSERRCGAGSVLNRLCEVLLVRILRHLMQTGAAETGLLAGLADPRLSKAIVAMHDNPERGWSAEDLAHEAGLSLSRFSDLFNTTVGESPMAYLRRWRLVLARQDLARGDRVDAISRRYGYRSPEGFSRAFRRYFGETPIQARRAVAP